MLDKLSNIRVIVDPSLDTIYIVYTTIYAQEIFFQVGSLVDSKFYSIAYLPLKQELNSILLDTHLDCFKLCLEEIS